MEHQAASALLFLPPTGIDEPPVDDDKQMPTITEGQPEREKTKIGAKGLHSDPGNGGLDTVKQA